MATTSTSWDAQVDDRINGIADGLSKDESFSTEEVPGLKSLLDDYIAPDVKVDDVDFVRRLLQVFRDSKTDNTFQDLLAKHTNDEQRKIASFVEGGDASKISEDFEMGPSYGCREELKKLQEASNVFHVAASGITEVKKVIESASQEEHDWFHSTINKLAEFFGIHSGELEAAGVLAYHNAEFQNWGLTVKNTPSLTCVPKTVKGIQIIVKFAKAHNMSVRCSGYRHSWAPVFSENGQILISMLNLHSATELPNLAALPLPESPPTELETIEVVGKAETGNGTLVRIGAGCINERLRRWCVNNNKLTIPFNIIMVEITIGGANGPICHGAGRKHTTLSDLVRKIEYVDAHGELQFVDNPEHLRAAGGCFGLMGPVTHITLDFAPMTYALTNPTKIPVICAVPPPADLPEKEIPPALLKYWTKLSSEQKAGYQRDFERQATDAYYSEWFWFPYSDYSWVNCWDDTTDPSGVENFPDNTHIFLSFIQTFAMNVMQNATLLEKLIQKVHMPEAAVTLLSRGAMFQLPEGPHKTYLTDALHFQRAIQNIRVRDVEVEIPLVAKKGNSNETPKIDYAPVQRAWWDAILLTYANSKTCPMRMPLEMRIMGGSNVIMAPQRYNDLGTCSIEVLTLDDAADIWTPFAQAVVDKWMALKNPANGERLRTRPHWAKEWHEDLKVDGKPWLDRLINVDYQAERQEFVDTLSAVGKEAGWTLADIHKRFSNNLFDKLFFGTDLRRANAVSVPDAEIKQSHLQKADSKPNGTAH